MTLSAKVGSFALNNTTGTQAVNTVGFQPKALIFWWNHLTADGSAATAGCGLGFACSSTQRGFTWYESLDAQATTASHRIARNDRCLGVYENETLKANADFVSMDSGGFTINLIAADAVTLRIVNYLALGGDTITNAYCGKFQTPLVTGDTSYTDPGFQPDVVLTTSASALVSTFVSGGGAPSFTAFKTGSQWVSCNRSQDNQAASNTIRYQRTDKASAHITTTPGIVWEAALTSMDSNGFTLNYSTVYASALDVIYLALKGGYYALGTLNAKTGTTGTVATTGLGFRPKALLLTSDNYTTSTSIQDGGERSIGAGDGTAQGCTWCGDQDAADPSVSDSNLDRTKVYKSFTEGTPTLESAAAVSTLDENGFTLNWTTVDATARELLYFAAGDTAYSPAGGNYVPSKMATYRRRHQS